MGRRECRSSKAAWWEQRPSFGQAHRAHQVWRVLMRSLRRSCFRGPTRTPTWSVRPFRPVHEDQGVSKALDETLQANCGTSKGSGSLPCCLRLPTARSPLCAPVACVKPNTCSIFSRSLLHRRELHSLIASAIPRIRLTWIGDARHAGSSAVAVVRSFLFAAKWARESPEGAPGAPVCLIQKHQACSCLWEHASM